MFARLALILTLALAVPPGALCAPPEPAAALLDAVARAPALEAARQRVAAARARLGAAGRWADPEVEAMASRVNAAAMGENRDMWEFNLRQPLPRRGERAADRDRATAAADLAEAAYALTAGELAADVALALAEAEGAESRIHLLETQRTRLAATLQSVETRLAAGGAGRLADRLTVQSRLAALELSLASARRTADDARAAARSRLGLDPAGALPAFAAPSPGEIRAAEAADTSAAQARIAEANALGRLARSGAHPMTAVGLRFERERSSMGNQDTVGLAFMSEIPWRNRSYARAEARGAEADRAAATAEIDAVRHRVANALSRVERAERVAAIARQLAADTQARLDAEHEALHRAAGVDPNTTLGADSAVLRAVDILDRTTETRLQIVEAETAARTARAELWRFAPAARLLPSLP